jgi:hypothetical protein
VRIFCRRRLLRFRSFLRFPGLLRFSGLFRFPGLLRYFARLRFRLLFGFSLRLQDLLFRDLLLRFLEFFRLLEILGLFEVFWLLGLLEVFWLLGRSGVTALIGFLRSLGGFCRGLFFGLFSAFRFLFRGSERRALLWVRGCGRR